MDRIIAAQVRRDASPAPDPLDVFFDFLIEEDGSVGTIYAHHTEEDMNLALVQPWCSIGSDGSALAVEGPLRARASPPAQLRHVSPRPGRIRPQSPAIAAGRRRAQDDLAQRRQGRAHRSRPAPARPVRRRDRLRPRAPSSTGPPTSSRSSTARDPVCPGQRPARARWRAAHPCPPRPRLAAWPMKSGRFRRR